MPCMAAVYSSPANWSGPAATLVAISFRSTVRSGIKPSTKSLYNIEYVDEEGEPEIKKAFLDDDELRALMDAFCEFGINAKVYRLSPGPMPDLKGTSPAVLSGNDRRRLGLHNPRDH